MDPPGLGFASGVDTVDTTIVHVPKPSYSHTMQKRCMDVSMGKTQVGVGTRKDSVVRWRVLRVSHMEFVLEIQTNTPHLD